VAPAAVLTSADGWSPLPVNRDRVAVFEADGELVGGGAVRQLAEVWRPVGVLRAVHAYRRYIPGAPDDRVGGRLEPAVTHGGLLGMLEELAQAGRAGAGEEELGWIASVRGVDDAVWRLLLPVHEGRAVWEAARPPDSPAR
jgi:hypothetical protein